MLPFFWILAVFSLLILLGAWKLYGKPGPWAAVALCVGLFLFCGMMMSYVLPLQAGLTGIAAILCAAVGARPRTMPLWGCVALAASYGFLAPGAYRGWSHHRELRSEYPMRSLAERLLYEENHVADPPERPLAPEVERRLKQFEERPGAFVPEYKPWDDGKRQFALRLLHDRALDQFIVAQGFGVIRMPQLHYRHKSEESLPLPETASLPLPSPPQNATGTETPASPLPIPTAAFFTTEELDSLHRSGLLDFLEPERIGYVQDREHVAGFRPHEFVKRPELQDGDWRITQLELISLLKHETPVAYISRNLPRMEELADAPTRPLNTFESDALEQLRFEQDLIVEENPDSIRMVGSVRAGNDCMKCHNVSRGELLGAFSYVLHRLPIAKE